MFKIGLQQSQDFFKNSILLRSTSKQFKRLLLSGVVFLYPLSVEEGSLKNGQFLQDTSCGKVNKLVHIFRSG